MKAQVYNVLICIGNEKPAKAFLHFSAIEIFTKYKKQKHIAIEKDEIFEFITSAHFSLFELSRDEDQLIIRAPDKSDEDEV